MSITAPQLEQALSHADKHIDESIARLFELLRIPSISTDPVFTPDCARAADWLARELSSLGFDASVRVTPGHPMVVAHDASASGPRVLFYGHYDVQPVDPLNLWHTDPFDPVVKTASNGEQQIVARGSADDKGQLMTFIEACRALKATGGSLPAKVTILLEGEEESGSPSLVPFLEGAKTELKADIALVCDTDMWDRQTPAITTMLRGLVGEEVTITCADRDLHSGMYGGAARNPNQVLAELIASLRNPDGSVTVQGFYNDVAELPPEVADMWRRLDFNADDFLGEVGLKYPAGEKTRSVMEQITSRPTCEINGMFGGYTGEGFKTVIPSKATAKISFRLVADQEPQKIRNAFRAHIRARIPADCSVSFREHGASPAISVPISGPFLAKARQALTDEWQKDAVIIGSGGSIPVVGEFSRILGMDTLLVGFSHTDDAIHSPNEKYNLTSFQKGIRSYIRILGAFAI